MGRQKRSVVVSSNGLIFHCIHGQNWDEPRNLALRKGFVAINLGGAVLLVFFVHIHGTGNTHSTHAIATIMGMALNSLPLTSNYDEKAATEEMTASGTYPLMSDVGLWGGVVPGNLADVEQLSELLCHRAVHALKIFLAPLLVTAGYEAISPDQLRMAAEMCGAVGKPTSVHSYGS